MRWCVLVLATVALCPATASEKMGSSDPVDVSSFTAAESSRVSGTSGPGLRGCPGRCRCEVDGLLHRVDCSDLGLQRTPSNINVFTSYLDLSMNNLTTLSSGDFSNLHFLEELRLAGNDLSFIPKGAFMGLYNLKVLMLQNNQLRSVPDDAFHDLHNLQSLRLDANHISNVPAGCFLGLRSLRHLWLDDNLLTEVPVAALSELPALQAMTLALNQISYIPDHAFSKLSRLVVLHLNNNRIVSMGTNCFHGLHSLETLFFYDNPIESVGRSAFQNLPELRTLSLNGAGNLTEFPYLTGTASLESLTITGTKITSLPPSVCDQLPNLELLDLSYNQLQTLPVFSGCESIQSIDLHHNEIKELEENTFHGLMSLHSLDLSWNKLSSVKPNSFSALPALTKLDLSSNHIVALSLTSLYALTHLRLSGNDQLMELIPRETLPRVRVMELPYAFQCCAFVSCEQQAAESTWRRENVDRAVAESGDTMFISNQVDHDWEDFLIQFDDEPKLHQTVHCSPTPGPFRPCLHLLGSWLIRGGVWLIAAISLVSNCLVVSSIFLAPVSMATPSKLLIGLLALVNGLLGVWSGWLAAVDAWTYGNFWRYGTAWESSYMCELSGFLYTFGSQTSIFLLTVAALERCLTFSTGHHKVQRQSGGLSSPALSIRLAIFLCFLLGLAITLPPLVAGHSSTSLCLLLPSSTSSASVAFSVFLVLLDSLCFLLMILAYARLYCQTNKSLPISEEDGALTRHVAWVLFSDCLLFLPVAFLSFSSLLHLPAAGPDAAKAVLLLVAPLPSCVNPLLYLLFNPLARDELATLAKHTCGTMSTQLSIKNRGAKGTCRSSPLDTKHDEDAEKQSCDSTQALVAIRGTTEEEEPDNGKTESQHTVMFIVPHH
ncbi:leucine-rich repeat-containing G-protein coupled receptor 5-like isoform X2 [Periophthalmus magnuspinnatus]|uniref:leucine-rich repeat-containing G-protein coupled receptor 5-like isoform X2 n=1 Tax=Periophthalmus magnuspinnatus TaxID=409849 RepID=UPI0024363B46|nr:leucine-rich repeat-containing G-protein coupled receptor 5-like isoform X2 [Periophthalmus magnuspinnatus]